MVEGGRIRYKSAEWVAVEEAKAAVFVLTTGRGTGAANAAILVKAAPRMVRLAPGLARLRPSPTASSQAA